MPAMFCPVRCRRWRKLPKRESPSDDQQTEASLAYTTVQQEINTRETAELRAILRDRYGNGGVAE
jgi:hypothetical protein